MGDKDNFALYKTEEKWDSICTRMRNIQQAETAFSMRRRVNPHHSKEQVRQETRAFRVEQYIKWCEVKDLYAEHRDEMASNTCNNARYVECKDILERIFTMELDEALRETIEE